MPGPRAVPRADAKLNAALAAVLKANGVVSAIYLCMKLNQVIKE